MKAMATVVSKNSVQNNRQEEGLLPLFVVMIMFGIFFMIMDIPTSLFEHHWVFVSGAALFVAGLFCLDNQKILRNPRIEYGSK